MPWLSRLMACLCSAAVVMFGAQALADDMAPDLKRATDCMLNVLKATRGVSDAKLGMSDDGGWTHPFLEYSGAASGPSPTRFDLQKPTDPVKGPFVFMGTYTGTIAPGHAPDIRVTYTVAKQWYTQCNVNAFMLFRRHGTGQHAPVAANPNL